MKVNFFATLRQIVGKKTVEFELAESATVRQLLDLIVETYPPMRAELLDEQGNLYQHVHLFVNGRDVPYLLDRIETVINPHDVINVFPAVGGG